VGALARAGFLEPQREADELIRAAERDRSVLRLLLARRLAGEPLAWVVGRTTFRGLELAVDPGVYVPRPQTEALAWRAAEALPADGVAIDLATGCGAIAAVLAAARPAARILATDADPAAVACARRNGVDALQGDLDEPLPVEFEGRVDVLTAVLPYVPTDAIRLLPRDVRAFEPRAALDGGPEGTDLLLEVVRRAPRWLRPGGRILLELGGDQAGPVGDALREQGLADPEVIRDAEGDARGIAATRRTP
jgi:release factor glutamine methyltransferase